MLTYEKAIAFMEETKIRGSVLGLANMQALVQALGNPQNAVRTIHIAGTNGKGSFGAYFASICKEAGFKVARYSSPAVFDSLECWQFDGRNITKEEYAACMSQVKEACDSLVTEGIYPTSFEIETALAFVYFKEMQPDIALLETGMGGALDATNVLEHSLACVFTKISRDHMQYLGESLKEIAIQKAGIIKPGAMVFWGTQEPEVEAVLEETLSRVSKEGEALGIETIQGDVYSSRIKLISQKPGELRFSYLGINYMTKMAGLYQMENASLAIAVFDAIWPSLLFGLSDEMQMWGDESAPLAGWMDMEYASRLGIWNAFWPGRFEVIADEPLFIIDGAHNEDAAISLSKTIENSFTNQPLTYIIGVLADKEHEKMLEILLPYAKRVICITPGNARGLEANLLAEEAQAIGQKLGLSVEVECCDSIKEAKDKARGYAIQENTPVLAFGSLSYLGELKNV